MLKLRHWWAYPAVLLGCSSCASLQSEPCSFENPRFAAYVASCRARVEFECEGVPDDACPALAECEREIDRLCRVDE